jgi:hypothetical protein
MGDYERVHPFPILPPFLSGTFALIWGQAKEIPRKLFVNKSSPRR